jgi:hypothetical protein
MKRRPSKIWLLVLGAIALSCGGCARPASLDDRPCPCNEEAGYFCCEGICLRAGQACPRPAGTLDAAGPDLAATTPWPDAALLDTAPAPDAPAPDSRPEVDVGPDVPSGGAEAGGAVDGAPGVACGGRDQACCPGNRCNNEGCCFNNVCISAFDMCPGVSASCTGRTCGSVCGGLREPCCPGRACVAPLTICVGRGTDAGLSDGRCESCGGPNEPCCAHGYCAREGADVCILGLCLPATPASQRSSPLPQ